MSQDLAGYGPGGAAHPGSAVEGCTRVGTCTATRMTGPFHVRGPKHVDYIQDGWLCVDEQGDYFGVEDAVLSEVIHVPIPTWTDTIVEELDGQVGVAYNAGNAVYAGPTYTDHTVSSMSITYGTLPAGITAAGTTDIELSGTPTTAGAYYYEITWVYDDGRSIVERHTIFIAAA